MSQPNSKEAVVVENDDDVANSKYLLYELASEYYGSPLLQIKEVLKRVPIKPIPQSSAHMLGIINLRGQIVSVMDLRIKFGLTQDTSRPGLILVVEALGGLIGVVVDNVRNVVNLTPDQIQKNVGIETKQDASSFLGVAHSDEHLVNMLDLSYFVSHSDMQSGSKNQGAA